MKKTVVIFAHPNVDEGSLSNIRILKALKEQENTEVREITKLYPNFKIDRYAEQEALLRADNIVFQFPINWYSVPGILKVWIDSVLTYGFAYGLEGDKLKGKEFILSATAGGPEASYKTDGYNNFDMHTFLTVLKQTASFVDLNNNEPILSFGMLNRPFNSKDEIEEKADKHGQRLIEWINKNS